MNINRITSNKAFSPVIIGVIAVLLATLPLYIGGYTPILLTSIYLNQRNGSKKPLKQTK